jgi:hypothetical protein
MRLKFLVVIFIFLLSTQKVFLATAESEYSEEVGLNITVDQSKMSYAVFMFGFYFNELSRPFSLYDFRSEPSFLSLSISARYFTNGRGYANVSIFLNSSETDEAQGRLVADMIKSELEKSFEISPLSYSSPFGHSPGELEFDYSTGFPATEFREIFLDSLPPQGFRQLLTPSLLDSHNYTMLVGLGTGGGWLLDVQFLNIITQKMVNDQEQIISLKEITENQGSIVCAPTVPSLLAMEVVFHFMNGSDYELMLNAVSPKQMVGSRNDYSGGYAYDFSYDVAGSSIEDFSISLKIVSVLWSTILSVAVVLGQITTALVSIIIIFRHDHKKGGESKTFFQQHGT